MSANDPSRYAERNHSILGWLMPTVRTSNFALLSAVGLDAVVVSGNQPPKGEIGTVTHMLATLQQFLDFLKTSFYFFSICAVAAALVLMPVNFFVGYTVTCNHSEH
jgi:calcium permeable stress-gated cation channel